MLSLLLDPEFETQAQADDVGAQWVITMKCSTVQFVNFDFITLIDLQEKNCIFSGAI